MTAASISMYPLQSLFLTIPAQLDQIIVLKDGIVAESPGTHSQLIISGGEYSKLWAGQPPNLASQFFII